MTVPRGHVYYVGPFSFPNGGAAARRIIGVAKSLLSASYEVTICSGQIGPASGSFEGLRVVSLGERTGEHLPRLIKHAKYFSMGARTTAWLSSLSERPSAVILYSGYSPYLLRLLPWARQNRIPLLFDAVEWYDPESLIGWASPYQLNIELAMRFLLPRVDGVISISSYLHRYYSQCGPPSYLMPPTLDVRDLPACGAIVTAADRRLRVVYAGTPGRKDLLDNIIEAVLSLRAEGMDVHVCVAGVTAEQAVGYSSVRSRLAGEVDAGVRFLGYVDHPVALELVRQADFTLLLRENARYANAGFPTKFVESFAVGTPVIANVTSDLGSYLRDAVTGFVCEGCRADDLKAALRRAFLQGVQARSRMRAQCREVALGSFDYRNFVDSFAGFIDSLRGS